MNRKLKALGLALLVVSALGAAPGVSPSVAHEFHSEEENTILTGRNVGVEKIQIGAAGTVECTLGIYEGTSTGSKVESWTYKADTITIAAFYSGCSFGSKLAPVITSHCSYVFDSETSGGNPDGGEHADFQIECAEGSKIEIHTAVCTITIGPQVVSDGVRYENDFQFSFVLKATAKKIVVGKARTTESQPLNGCLTFPTGAIGTMTGTSTYECFEDEGDVLIGTTKTTANLFVGEGERVGCSVA